MRFLFRLDLNLHADAGIFFGILNYATKQGLTVKAWQVTDGSTDAELLQPNRNENA